MRVGHRHEGRRRGRRPARRRSPAAPTSYASSLRTRPRGRRRTEGSVPRRPAPDPRPRSPRRSATATSSCAIRNALPTGRVAAAGRRATGRLPGHPARRPAQRLHRRLRVPRFGPRGRGRRRTAGATWPPARAGSSRRRAPSTSSAGRDHGRSSTTGCPAPQATRAPAIQAALETLGIRSPSRAEGHGLGSSAGVPATGAACPRRAQARTGARLILSVWVRGKSSSGQRRQPAIRWLGPSVALAALTAASIRARTRPVRLGRPGRPAAGQHDASIRPGSVSTTTESRMPAMRSAFSMSSGYTLNPLGRTMMSLIRPGQDQPAVHRPGGRCRRSCTSRPR